MTMTDRELLERAARAAGHGEVWYLEGSATPYIGPRYEPGQKIGYSVWTPLTDDGDALRLAVKLGILIAPPAYNGGWQATASAKADELPWMDETAGSHEQATRRVIVRAAAALARKD